MELLRIDNVTKHYTGHTALNDVSFSVPQGCIYGLLGPNGAGKTTLIRIINHITAPDSGTVTFDGHTLTAADIYNIGYLPEERGLYKKMKVGEQAIFFARLKGLSRSEAQRRLKFWFAKLGIEDWWNKKVEELSKGMAQKIQFIITVLHEPKLLIFDEPFSGFDPINADQLKHEILELRDKGATIIFSTHNMSSVEEICDHITLINQSQNILTGNVDEIKRRYGKDRFIFTYSGEAQMFGTAIADKAHIISDHIHDNGIIDTTLQINSGTSLRQIIADVNDVVEIRTINEAIPSMNEIFIQTVKEFNNAQK
ncbi:MAG: ABC transporter ATP-binding protein [Muribaculaceae bacterium]